MILVPPRGTVFPYTTLFRSRDDAHELRRAPGDRARRRRPWPSVPRERVPGSEDRCVDRKSTRLNSSHTVNAYAVFCLREESLTGLLIVPPVLGFRLPGGDFG